MELTVETVEEIRKLCSDYVGLHDLHKYPIDFADFKEFVFEYALYNCFDNNIEALFGLKDQILELMRGSLKKV